MADAPARRGLNLSNPGRREYVIVGLVAVGVGLIYLWRKKQAAAQQAAQQAAQNAPVPQLVQVPANGGGIPHGLLSSLLQNLQSQPSSGTTSSATGGTSTTTSTGQQSSTSGAGSPSTGSAGGGTAGGLNLNGLTLSQAVAQIAQSGAVFNAANDSVGVAVTPASGGNRIVYSTVYHPTGQSGQYFANSYSLAVQ